MDFKIYLNYQETRTLPTESKEVLSVLCYLQKDFYFNNESNIICSINFLLLDWI